MRAERAREKEESCLVVQVVLVPADLQSIADALRQIEAEYREMPGLSVTEAQARRLWGLDKTTCRRALDALVERGVLRRTWREAYVSRDCLPPAPS